MGNNTSRFALSTEDRRQDFANIESRGSNNTSLCSRCTRLLSEVVDLVDDGSSFQGQELKHSASMHGQSTSCVVCEKTKMLLDVAKDHVSFEETLRHTPDDEWSLVWRPKATDSKTYVKGCVQVLITARHKKGYGWGIGGFKLHPDCTGLEVENEASGTAEEQAKQPKIHPQDYPVITSLDPDSVTEPFDPKTPDFSSTIGSGPMNLIESWGRECMEKHPKCNHIFGGERINMQAKPWYPDRLIRLTTVPPMKEAVVGQNVDLTARIVEKSSVEDFPPAEFTGGVHYFSLSHCWGPPPDPSARLGGREKDVLTQEKLSAWKKDVPVDDLPLTFQDAIRVCIMLHVEHIWIDSLCIIQDSHQDWLGQSAVMADVYKYAWLNIAALESLSDSEGFINDHRDPKIEFGFRANFANMFGRSAVSQKARARRAPLLEGETALVWDSWDHRGGRYDRPLFSRAWVFQERNLARRTLAFTKTGILWACDGFQKSEYPGGGSSFEPEQLRTTMQGVIDTASHLVALAQSVPAEQVEPARRQALFRLVDSFDWRWHSCITSYTMCALTKQTDKLIAFSAVARELENSGLTMGKRYLAGLWEVNLPFQLAWITVEGKTTPRKFLPGEAEYVAPSWSWASIAGPVQPRTIFPKSGLIALAAVTAADVELQSDFKFGSVKGAWIRMKGRLNKISLIGLKGQSLYLVDKVTSEDLWFASDTIEGRDLGHWRQHLHHLVWVPLTLSFQGNMLGCNGLVLAEYTIAGAGGEFSKPGERIYRRLGTFNFGRIPSMLKQDPLLLSLGTWPDMENPQTDGSQYETTFRRSQEALEEVATGALQSTIERGFVGSQAFQDRPSSRLQNTTPKDPRKNICGNLWISDLDVHGFVEEDHEFRRITDYEARDDGADVDLPIESSCSSTTTIGSPAGFFQPNEPDRKAFCDKAATDLLYHPLRACFDLSASEPQCEDCFQYFPR